MQLNAYVFFNGSCEEALEHYREALGGEIQINRYEGSPGAAMAPSDWGNKVMHGRLVSPAGTLMAADTSGDHWHSNKGENFSLSVETTTEAEADAVFTKLSAGGAVTMPMAKTFWGAKFGMLVDRFGIKWMVNCPLG
ncbi:MAG: VOC family protein [Candidatus Eremiobacteraeota bacterium]|nr:VOC family protein [Candidatus Eremiobacteraeota bacterium]